uniref:Uncharacterized protein n=1 Tax=Oncorhynchus tshawytscha TaxID=74940 RepID=A0A8C8BWU0_ONCTS
MVAFGEILINVGDVGLFQKLILLGLCLQNLIFPVLFTSFLFVQTDSGRHCNTDWILRAGANLSSEEQLNLTVPREQHGAFSRCLMFNPVDWDINTIRENGFRPLSARRDGSTTRHYETTIVTSFDLVCEKDHLVGVAQTMFMAGIGFGSLFFGPTAESYGHRQTTTCGAGLITTFVMVAPQALVLIYISILESARW